jgi:hypothetical protein
VTVASLVKPEFGPTLPDLLSPLPRALRIGLAVAGAAALLAAGVAVTGVGSASGETAVLVRDGGVVFNLAHGSTLERATERGALLALERRRPEDGLFVDSFVVRALTVPAYAGLASGTLPLVAGRYEAQLSERYDGFQKVGEGRARVNDALGYAITFRASLGERTLYGRHVLLLADELGGRRGVVLELEATPAGGTPNVNRVGAVGALKLPLRSFRFGTERVGGQ